MSKVLIIHRLGGILIETFRTWQNAEKEVAEHILVIEHVWFRTTKQMSLLKRVAQEIERDYCRIMDGLVMALCTKLSAAVTEVQKIAAPGAEGKDKTRQSIWAFGQSVDKWQYVRVKSTLSDMVKDLEEWQRRFDPSWLFLVRMNKPSIGTQLQRGIEELRREGKGPSQPKTGRKDARFESDPLECAQGMRAALRATANQQKNIFLPVINMDTQQIPYSTAWMARPDPRSEWRVVDSVPCQAGSDTSIIRANVRQLAHKLRQVDPSAFGLLTCQGVIETQDTVTGQRSFDFVYYMPRGVERLASLRDSLVNSRAPSLNRRLSIARELVKSINHVHIFDFVHKNVRPESVLLFEDAGTQRISTFLVGFEGFRRADGASAMLGDTLWHKNIYRHPARQGEYPAEYYRMQHDIYSLGVCLLEIGLWDPFVCYSEDASPRMGRHLLTLRDWLRQNDRGENWWGWDCKEYLTSLARDRLPSAMGERYSNVVLTCLTCLDKGNDGIGDEDATQDADGTIVGVQFFEKIMLRIHEIVI